jgi:aldehyde dehydrogenase
MPTFAQPGTDGSVVTYKSRYDHWIGGEYVAPVKGGYFENISPVNGKVFCEIARGTAEDIDAALDAAHAAAPAWGKTSVAERAVVLNKIADRIEQNLEMLAVGETWENGKPVRETLAADMPLVVDHFRYFAGAIRAQEGHSSQIDDDTVAYHFQEPLGVVGQIIPWNFPILMATWKLAPALAAGNAIVLKPAEQTPASILLLMELIADLLPPGVLNVVNGFGVEAGKPLASSSRIRKIAFTGETTTGRLIMQYASQNLIPVTLELGGKSPNIFFEDVSRADDAFYDKALEGFSMFALNQGEVCTCPSRALIQNSIIDAFLPAATDRVKAMVQGNPLDTDTMVGAQASNDQLEKILSYLEIGVAEGARVITGGERVDLGGDLSGGYYVAPTIFQGNNKMRVFQEEIFGPVVSVTGFEDYDEAISIANDTLYGLGAGVWSRDINTAYRAGRDIQAGRVWTNCYHQYPAHAAFGGYKSSGIGRENHLMMLDHYQQTKNLLVSYNPNKLGFF